MRKSLLTGLTEEQIKKIEACNSVEEVLKIAKNEGSIELTEEQLGAVTGGGCFDADIQCPYCQSYDVEAVNTVNEYGLSYYYVCKHCHREFTD